MWHPYINTDAISSNGRSFQKVVPFRKVVWKISVITDNYRILDLNSLDTAQAFQKLADFVGRFIDSGLLV